MTVPDADRPTLHLRCGNDIAAALQKASFTGAFLAVSDPLPQGPVPHGPNLLSIRACFIASAYGLPETEARADLDAAQSGLEAAATSNDRIVLWFEHDSYDQLILARVLDALAGRPGVELICISHHPRPTRFIGLGQLTPAELADLWPTRIPVGPAHYALGRAVWRALRDASPMSLFQIAQTGTPAIPAMAPALLRHLQELPWQRDGLSLTERLVLGAILAGADTAGQVFAPVQQADPLPFLGNLMLLPVLAGLATAVTPALRIGEAGRWPCRPVALTHAGTALLQGQGDWQAMHPPERWVGGVRVAAGASAWQWNEKPIPC